MSHLKERKEKICLNCDAVLAGRYCHVCGQENLEPKETVWHLITHFFNDITHFDGKFFETVKLLLRKPGFLSEQYTAGKRASFLNPIRMYVFTSAIFFILLFSLRGNNLMNFQETPDAKQGLVELNARKAKLEASLVKDDDDDTKISLARVDLKIRSVKHKYGDSTTMKLSDHEMNLATLQYISDSLQLRNISRVVKDEALKKLQSAEKGDDTSEANYNFFGMNVGQFHSVEEYDSTQRKLPGDIRDDWLTRMTKRKMIHLQEAYREDKKEFKARLKENVLHSFPKILFVTLPIFALLLNMLYFRHKKYFYVDHGIFTIHVYCSVFILLMMWILLQSFSDLLNLGWFKVVSMIIGLGIWFYIFIYLYKAMRGFYHQRRFKTFVKYFIICLLSFVINVILFVVFMLISVINVA